MGLADTQKGDLTPLAPDGEGGGAQAPPKQSAYLDEIQEELRSLLPDSIGDQNSSLNDLLDHAIQICDEVKKKKDKAHRDKIRLLDFLSKLAVPHDNSATEKPFLTYSEHDQQFYVNEGGVVCLAVKGNVRLYGARNYDLGGLGLCCDVGHWVKDILPKLYSDRPLTQFILRELTRIQLIFQFDLFWSNHAARLCVAYCPGIGEHPESDCIKSLKDHISAELTSDLFVPTRPFSGEAIFRVVAVSASVAFMAPFGVLVFAPFAKNFAIPILWQPSGHPMMSHLASVFVVTGVSTLVVALIAYAIARCCTLKPSDCEPEAFGRVDIGHGIRYFERCLILLKEADQHPESDKINVNENDTVEDLFAKFGTVAGCSDFGMFADKFNGKVRHRDAGETHPSCLCSGKSC